MCWCSVLKFLDKFYIELCRYANMCLVLGIGEFISHGFQTVSKFESVVKHIQKYEQEIETILQTIITAKILIFPVKPDKSDDLPGM